MELEELVAVLQQGPNAWNRWRKMNPTTQPDLARIDAVGQNLSEADFSLLNLTRARLNRSNFRRANFTQANLSGAAFSGADLSEATLKEANLRWASLTRANLREADLRGVNFNNADLSGADLRGADLTGANLTDAKLTRTIMPDGNYYEATLNVEISVEPLLAEMQARLAEAASSYSPVMASSSTQTRGQTPAGVTSSSFSR